MANLYAPHVATCMACAALAEAKADRDSAPGEHRWVSDAAEPGFVPDPRMASTDD